MSINNRLKISAILITKNESKNIRRCLESICWVDEIIIVDSGSTDDTIKIAASFKNVKIISADWIGYTENKKLALSHTNNDWIFWIDADEEVSVELKKEILSLPINIDKAAYDMPRKTYFLREWVQHTGWYPGRVIRLFNKNQCHFNNNILHEGLIVNDKSKLQHLTSDIHHYSYTSVYQYFQKMNFYGEFGAKELIRQGKNFNTFQLLVNPFATFIKFYFIKKGFLDGKKGLIISIGSAFSNFIKYVNFYYLERENRRIE
jgi:(heptosyl)LPS beta-1,4-glucosyltransferase